MPPKGQSKQAQLKKRDRDSTGENEQEQKKPRRSTRIPTILSQLPTPITNQKSNSTESFRDGTVTPPEGRPSQIQHHQLPSSQLESPPQETQPFSQLVRPSNTLSDSVKDEDQEGVWGYLVPMDSKFGDTLVLRRRAACPAPFPSSNFGKGDKDRGKGVQAAKEDSFTEEEEKYEQGKTEKGFPAGGYLIGRHRECDRVLELPTISNRHCLIFNETKDGDTVAILQDLSSNGTFVNETIVGRNKHRDLEDNDEITILDQTRFIFRYPANRDSNAFRRQFRVLDQLGRGHFATVYLCVEKATGYRYAVKKFERRPGEQIKMEGLKQEIAVLMSVSHPNMLCLKDSYEEKDGVYLVLELAPEGELFNLIVSKQKLSEEECRRLFIQLFQGIKYLHDRGIVHRDIKPENILLVDKNLTVKLADFGLAKIIGESSFTTTLCGTPSYVAPEILENSKHRKYTRAVDIWSLGVVLYICLCGFPPFSDELNTPQNPYTLSQQIKLAKFDYPSPYWDSVGDPALDLIDKMLTVDPERRATVEECLEHPWLTQKWGQAGVAGDITASMDSTDGLSGALKGLDFSKRKVARERTLLSDLTSVKVSKMADDGSAKVWEKKPLPQHVVNAGGEGAGIQNPNGNGKDRENQQAEKARNEETPAAGRDPAEFMEMGGKDDVTLFGDDPGSRYSVKETKATGN